MASKKEVILITGSSGCLGQHIIKLLQEKDDTIEEIRLYDRRPYENKLGHVEKIYMKHFVADVRDRKTLFEAMSGVDCVIHCATVIDLRLFPDVEDMVSTNITGTTNVIDGCVEKNVPRLVYASTTYMVCGSEHVFYGTENTTPIPKTWMIGKYGETKCKSEKLVLDASGRMLSDGETPLRAVALRPTPFYGEEDTKFFYGFLKYAKNHNGYYRRVRSLDERLQISYVGNVAWAFLRAKDRLIVDKKISGEAFFVTDDHPIIDIHEHVQPYLEAKGFTISEYVFPYWLVWIFLSLVCLFIRIINVFVKYEVDITPVSQLNFLCSTFFYNRSKATLRLDYLPLYTPEEAKVRSLPYYSKVEL